MSEITLRERIQKALKHYHVTIYKLAEKETDRTKLGRQINSTTTISADTVMRVLRAIPNLSAEYLLRGEGTIDRKDAPTNITRQDIHLAEGATAAISQSGEATVESAPADNTSDTPSTFTPADVASMLRDGDTAGLVGIILQQQATIEQMKDEQIAKLNQLLSYFDTKTFDLFTDPK